MDWNRIHSRLTALGGEHCVPGAQLAVHHEGKTRHCEFGEVEHGTGRPLTADLKIPIGSITKTFTAALAMILVSDGDLELDAPLADSLPELDQVARDLGTGLTLRHLLSHTGGLPSDPDDVRTTSLRRHVLDACRSLNPLHPPGEGFSYSNIGYVLVGHLIEVLTGMTWWEAVETILLRPLGLPGHFVVGPHADASVVPGHAVNAQLGRAVPVEQSLTVVDAPAGALAASALDLVALGRLLAGERPPGLVDPAALVEMRTPVRHADPFGMADGWGLGVALYDEDDSTWVGHDGTGDGTSCHLRVDPGSGTVVALTCNGSSGFAMWRELVGELHAAGLPVGDYRGPHRLKKRITPPPGCTGSFLNGDTEYAVRAAEREKLFLTVDGEPFADLALFDGLIFAMRDSDTGDTSQTGRFLRDPDDGGIGWIQIGGRLARRSDRVREVA
jgi:CubicO group peptidase (beta-lactamase class C family)